MNTEISVLIVDDERDICELIEIALGKHLQKINLAYEVSAALSFLDQVKYDCIVLDIRLGESNGAEIIQHITQDKDHPNIETPIVLISGFVSNNFIEKMKGRFTAIMRKPFLAEEVVANVLEITGVDPNQGDKVSKIRTDGPLAVAEVSALQEKVNKMLDQIGKKPRLKKLFKEIQSPETKDNYLKEHASLLINITTAISKHMDWTSKAILEKFVYAAYLHDESLCSSPRLAHFKNRAEIEDKRDELTDEEYDLVINHPTLSAKHLSKMSGVPDDVATIIEQHHGQHDGSGFPKGIDHKIITPLSALFIISHELVDYIHEHPKWKLEDFIKVVNSKYKTGGQFRKVINALKQLD